MSSANYSVGLSGEEKNSSRVLKPPGGETHDIFGTRQTAPAPPGGVATAKPHLQSNIFGQSNGQQTDGSPNSKQRNGNSEMHKILTGKENDDEEEDEEEGKPRKVKDYMKSTIFDDPEPDQAVYKKRLSGAGLGAGNPITGEGYKNGVASINEPQQPFTRVRNPPGGASSKLW